MGVTYEENFLCRICSCYFCNRPAAADKLAASHGKTGLYTSKSQDEAKILYDKFINKNNPFPKATLTEITAFSVKEPLGNAIYNTDCGLLYFEDKASAKAFFDEYNEKLKPSNSTNKNGFKDGYAYVISYKLSANRDGNCDWMRGVYLRGNSVLIISGFSPIGIKDTFCDRVFSSLDLIDPATLNKDKT